MHRELVLSHLELARRHLAAGEERVANQERLVCELEREFRDTRQAKELLAQLQVTQDLYIYDVQRLEKELARFSE